MKVVICIRFVSTEMYLYVMQIKKLIHFEEAMDFIKAGYCEPNI